MLNRFFLVFAALALPFLVGAIGHPVFAETTDFDPGGVGFQGLPDNDTLSAKFLVLDGPSNNGLGGTPGGEGQRTDVVLTFSPSAAQPRIQIALFDPNSVGLWDQRVDFFLLSRPPEVTYELFSLGSEDLATFHARLTDGNPANDPAPLLTRSALTDYNQDPTSDNAWCSFYDELAGNAPLGAQDGFGRYRFFLRIQLEPHPSRQVLRGPERAAHKIAFNGTYLFPANSTVGFAGGAIDVRTRVNEENRLQLDTQDPETTEIRGEATARRPFYDGRFDFFLHNTQGCDGDIVFSDADADWNRNVADPSVDVDTDPTGLPPDSNVNFYRRDSTSAFRTRDITGFHVGGQINWSIFPVTAIPPVTSPPYFRSSNAALTGDGHPSITAAQENGGSNPFKSQTLDGPTINGTPGLWYVRWDEVDKSNFVYMRFNRAVGTTPRDPSLRGKVFCDANGNDVFDGPDTLLDTPFDIRIQRIDCASDAPIGQPIDVVTNSLGDWGPVSVPAGCYFVDAPSAGMPAGITLPVRALVDEVECEATVDIPLLCSRDITVYAYCEQTGDCVYTQGVDEPLVSGTAATVTLTPATAQGTPTGPSRTETIDDLDPMAVFTGLAPGFYLVTVQASGPFALAPACTDSQVVELKVQAPGQPLPPVVVHFGYLCCEDFQISGNVYCEESGDCEFGGGDLPLPKPSSVTIAVTPVDGNDIPFGTTRMTKVVAPATAYSVGNLAPGRYEVTYTILPGDPHFDLDSGCSDTRYVVLDANTCTAEDIDFGFSCLCMVRGRVWCDWEICDGGWQRGRDVPIEGLKVVLEQNGEQVGEAYTLIDGTYEFVNVPTGTFQVRIPPGQPQVAGKTGPEPRQRTVTCSGRGIVYDQDFWYCPKGAIVGGVFCDLNGNGRFDPRLGECRAELQGFPIFLSGDANSSTLTGTDCQYDFDQLPAGRYEVSTRRADYVAAGVVPPDNLVIVVTIQAGDIGQAYFPAVCPAKIVGSIWCDPLCDCNGRLDSGDRRLGGVEVELRGPIPGGSRVTATDPNGNYEFDLLPLGRYSVEVRDPNPNPDYYALRTSRTVHLTLDLPGGEERADFGFCAQEIVGRVFLNPWNANCDTFFHANVDVPLAGVWIDIRGVTGEAQRFQAQTLTDSQGNYSFEFVPIGSYEIRVSANDENRDLLSGFAPEGATVRTPAVSVGECVPDVDFAYCEEPPCTQDLCVKVFIEEGRTVEPGECELELPADLVEVCVDIGTDSYLTHAISGAGELDGMYAAWCIDVRGATGVGCNDAHLVSSLDPAGNQAISAPENWDLINYLLNNLDRYRSDHGATMTDLQWLFWRLSDPTLEPPELPGNDLRAQAILDDVRKNGEGFVPGSGQLVGVAILHPAEWIQETLIGVRLECPPEYECDGRFHPGADRWAAGVQVRVDSLDYPGRFVTGVTDADGSVCFFDLLPGAYDVSVDPNQPALRGAEPSTRTLERVTVVECEDREVIFGFCRECGCEPCCEGDLHEVVTQTRIRVGDSERPFDVSVRFFGGPTGCGCDEGCNDGCGNEARGRKSRKARRKCGARQLIDRVSVRYDGGFPGQRTGLSEVLTIQNVVVEDCYATVTVRVTAQGPHFPQGKFGKRMFRLTAKARCRTNQGCSSFRCERLQPGAWFTWIDRCGERPSCDTRDLGPIDPDRAWSDHRGMRWSWKRRPKWLVLETCSFTSWCACQGDVPCREYDGCDCKKDASSKCSKDCKK